MEVFGTIASSVALAALFRSTLAAFDLVHLYRDYDSDVARLQLQIKIEKCRLYVWGEAMGLTPTDGSSRNLLEDWQFVDLVAQCLRLIIHIFNDAEGLESKYGCQPTAGEKISGAKRHPPEQGGEVRIAAAFNHFKIQEEPHGVRHKVALPPMLRKTRWVIRDRGKFTFFIHEVQNLISGLQNITSDLSGQAQQKKRIEKRIARIRDVNALNEINSACKLSYPHIASAASAQADSISSGTDQKHKISRWRAEVEDQAQEELSISNLEKLTVIEMKHVMIKMAQQQTAQDRVITSLEAQLSTRQYKLTRDSGRDSKSRRMFSFSTILFLPWVLVSTLLLVRASCIVNLVKHCH